MSKRITVLGVAVLQLCLWNTANAQDEGGVKDPFSYFLGMSVGQQMNQSGFKAADINLDGLLEGFRDGIDGKEPRLTREQLNAAQQKIQSLLQTRMQERKQVMVAQAAKNKEIGAKFLAENAKKEGVKEIQGGVQVKELKAGTGPQPKLTDTVKVHYTGKLINGTKFDSSVDRGEPAKFPVNGVIKGWQIAIPEMKVGSKWMVYIPSDLAYGSSGSPPNIGPNEVLVFEVELLGIE